MSEPWTTGVLEFGCVRLPVQLLDQSAEGFAVLADEPPGVKEGDVAQLHTELGAFEVQAMNSAEVELTEADGSPETGGPAKVYRLGLRRLGDLHPTNGEARKLAARCLRSFLDRLCSSGVSMVWTAFGLVVTVLVVAGTVVALLWSSDNLVLKTAPRRIGHTSPASPKVSKSTAGSQKISLLERIPKVLDTRSDTRSDPMPKHRDEAHQYGSEEFRRDLRRLSGAAPFMLPQVIDELKLTDLQQEQIHQLEQRTSEIMREINSQRQPASRQQISQIRAKVLEAARQDALDTLTDEQRARWMQIVESEEGEPAIQDSDNSEL
ncbi:MAG: hypothetical protein A2V70_06730 [Planctomycetes bacterium RBG_13_63_9]|nr:MAG: hypothetical protein A2V70_06730 [Planctomycetes bacterium RBG_13_63_9]